MSRLIIVSNRVPLPDKHGNPPPGGMAIALHAALKRHTGLWLGWSGEVSDQDASPTLTFKKAGQITYALTDLSQQDVDEYYNGFANRVLWPIFHCRIDLAEYARREMSGYYRVNRLFADLLMPLLKADDIVWVHDYHLIPLAEELRIRGCQNPIGFFLHIPWPPADIFFTAPVYDVLLRGLSSYDLVGFHTAYDLDNFVQCLQRERCGDRLDENVCRAYGKVFRCGVFPISIDTSNYAHLAEQSATDARLKSTTRNIVGYELVIGVDRLDYSKGIDYRIEAFRRFLQMHDKWVGKTLFLQITPKSRSEIPEYAAMQKDVAALSGRINGEFGTLGWMPVHYINQSLGPRTLAGLYRMARVGLVTPLRDGMNLVAKEYVAAQNPRDPGVLVLSRFAGAAREMDGAIIVNPYDIDAMANAIDKALSMPLEARRERWDGMIDRLRSHDVYRWCDDFLSALERN